ncbi:S1 family peptidase [Georgenia faecalis]|uniref:Serine protease n=1 Tax=Georgenia faecalis TaxID=2483799 RepID=A0ABV9DCG8_9MICO|nr:serine protease [Georgenia faecalis]
MSRRPAAAFAVVLLAGTAACGAVPAMPGPLPTTFVPDDVAPVVADPGSLSPDGVDAAERMAVRVRNVGCGELSTGSGFALDERTIITNRHVAANSSRLQITTYDGREIEAVSAGGSDLADLALLRTEEPLTSVPGIAEVDAAAGDQVTVIGYPEGGQLTTTTGQVLGYEPDPLGSDLGMVGRTNAEVDHGSSGSAVLNADGEVIGVVYAMDMWGNSYMVPVSTLHELLAEEAFTPLTACDAPGQVPGTGTPTEAPGTEGPTTEGPSTEAPDGAPSDAPGTDSPLAPLTPLPTPTPSATATTTP